MQYWHVQTAPDDTVIGTRLITFGDVVCVMYVRTLSLAQLRALCEVLILQPLRLDSWLTCQPGSYSLNL